MKNMSVGILAMACAVYLQIQNCVVATEACAVGGEPVVQIGIGIAVTGLVLLGKRFLYHRIP